MKKKIAFISNGCQNNFGRPREIIASIPELVETSNPEDANYIMVNFCAISADNINGFTALKRKITQLKEANPTLKVLAGGCIEGLSVKKDLSFADAIYHHQEEATAFLRFLGYDAIPNPQPAIIYDVAYITIAQGCNRRCTFCKTNYLNHMQLTSRPLAEIITLIYAAIDQGVYNIALVAENSTEWGCDIGTNIGNLLQAIFTIKEVKLIDVYGLCMEEIDSRLLSLLQHPKVRQLQLEVQSLDNQVRKSMGLHKTTAEALAILDALHDKAISSTLITGFVNSNVKEFDKELKLIRAHHLYYLVISPYDDTEDTPSHQFYQKPSEYEMLYYQTAFTATVAAERQIVLEQLMAKEYIEASVVIVSKTRYTLMPTNHIIKIIAHNCDNSYKVGDIVRVKITRLHQLVPKSKQHEFLSDTGHAYGLKRDSQYAKLLQDMQYFGGYDQIMMVRGTIIAS